MEVTEEGDHRRSVAEDIARWHSNVQTGTKKGVNVLSEDELEDIPSDVYMDSDCETDRDYVPNQLDSDMDDGLDLMVLESETFNLHETQPCVQEMYVPSDDDHLQSPCPSDDEGAKRRVRYRYWNPETDYERDIKLEIGLVFTSSEEFKTCLREFAIQKGFCYSLKTNEKTRCVAWCSQNCGWKIRASYCKDSNGFTIKSLNGDHKCPRSYKNKRVTSEWIANKIVLMVQSDVDWKVQGIRNHVRAKYHVDPSVWQCYRAKKMALTIIQGQEKEQYLRLRDYCHALHTWNPGSSAIIHSPGGVFERMYVCLDACKRGFMEACRPLISLDGCHLKTSFGGQLLCAIGKDANEGMYPIAFAVVEIENGETWNWFIQLLLADLRVHEAGPYTFISDQQKGLVGALKNFVDPSRHRFCLRHLYANFKGKFKGSVLKNLLWKAASATTERWFKQAMDEMKSLDDVAYKWLSEKDPRQWARHKFPTDVKSDMIMNNLAETFNAWILEA